MSSDLLGICVVGIRTPAQKLIRVVCSSTTTIKDLHKLISDNYEDTNLKGQRFVFRKDKIYFSLESHSEQTVSETINHGSVAHIEYSWPTNSNPCIVLPPDKGTGWQIAYQDKTYELTLKTPTDEAIKINVNLNVTITQIKETIQAQTGFDVKQQQLVCGYTYLSPHDTVAEANVGPDAIVDIVMPKTSTWKTDFKDKSYISFVKTLTGKVYALRNMRLDVTVDYLKLLIEVLDGAPLCQQRLIMNGIQMCDGDIIGKYDMGPGDNCHLVLRLRGGMYNETSGRNGGYQPLPGVTTLYLDLDPDQIKVLERVSSTH